MTRKPELKQAPVALRRAIANLLRLAGVDLEDARRLMEQDSLWNAAKLQHSATVRMTQALVASEIGRCPEDAVGVEVDALDDANPVKAALKSLEASAYRQPPLLADGRLPAAPATGGIWDGIDRAASLLSDLATHFKTDLKSEAPAGVAAPIRLEQPAPEAEPDQPEPPAARQPLQSEVPAERSPMPRPEASPSLPDPKISSTVFWSLMDRWAVADLDALALLGHPGGLTKKGTRPRFKLSDAETDMLIRLRDVDGALTSLGFDPSEWLRKPIAAAPFQGREPILFVMQNRAPGARELSRYILQQGLRQSLQKS